MSPPSIGPNETSFFGLTTFHLNRKRHCAPNGTFDDTFDDPRSAYIG